MTSPNTIAATTQEEIHFVFPYPPEKRPEDMTTFKHLGLNGLAHALTQHLSRRGSVLVGGELFLSPEPTQDMAGLTYPDLVVAFGADQRAYYQNNAYIISVQGKPPDLVLEIASPSTASHDRGEKRQKYEALGVQEYWRFDDAGVLLRTKLAGDRLVNGRYEPIPIEELEDGVLQGYSEVLDIFFRWEQGDLGFHDPATGRHIATFEDERARADNAEARARELEEELRRLRGD